MRTVPGHLHTPNMNKPGGERFYLDMEGTGMARRIDDLGRIVLPAETRRLLGIKRGDELSISVDGRTIVLAKLEVSCTFCGAESDLRTHHDKKVCASCVSSLTEPAAINHAN